MSATNVSTKPYVSKFTIVCNITLLIIIGVFLLVRLPSLLAIPLFNDEAVYLQRAVQFPMMLQETLQDGKLFQELLLAAAVRLPFNNLVLGRLISVASGFGTLLVLVHAGHIIQSPRAGLIAAALYSTAPLVVLHDLLAIPDSLLTFVSVIVMIATFHWVKLDQVGRWESALLGILIGVAALVKLTGVFLLCIPVLAVLVLTPRSQWQTRLAVLRVTVIALFACIVLLSPWHYGGAELHKTESLSLMKRTEKLIQNIEMTFSSLIYYLPAPLLAILALAWLPGQRKATSKTALWLAFSGGAYIVALLVVGSTIYPRYLLLAYPLLLLAIALHIDCVLQGAYRIGRLFVTSAVALALAWNGFFAYQLWHNPLQAPMQPIDRSAYLGTWTAGYGLPNLNQWLLDQTKTSARIVVILHDQPRLIHLSSYLELRGQSNIDLITIDLQQETAIEQLDKLAGKERVFIPIDDQERIAFAFDARFKRASLKQVYINPLGTMRFYIYEYMPTPNAGTTYPGDARRRGYRI